MKLGAKDVLIKANFTPQDVLDKLAKYVPARAVVAGGEEGSGASPTSLEAVLAVESSGAILVVEDDPFLCKLLIEKLAKEGFNVAEATSGKEALDYLQTKNPSLVLLDLMLAGEIDGFGVLAEIKKGAALQAIPVIVLSNLGDKENIERAMSLGAKDYLIKAHFVLDEIIAKIRKYV
ncbi:MAG: response regulator [Parcubacteria group bacterium]|nr:response regulator [Parcubacteria group bacterium]